MTRITDEVDVPALIIWVFEVVFVVIFTQHVVQLLVAAGLVATDN